MHSMLDVMVFWRRVGRRSDWWGADRCLYAYVDSADSEVLYVGKADFSTVRERWSAHQQDGVFECFDDVDVSKWHTIVGQITTGTRLTQQLLSDIEGLLIRRLLPRCNAQVPRTTRPGLRLHCGGAAWPERELFVDRG